MGVYAVRPFAFVAGQQLLTKDELLPETWISNNADVLVGYWNADIEYTEDLSDKIQPVWHTAIQQALPAGRLRGPAIAARNSASLF